MTKWSKSLWWMAMFFALTACGSKPGDLRRIGGAISGLAGKGLVLQLNGGHDLAVAANATAFQFDTWMVEGVYYNVAVTTQPDSPTQSCTVTANGTGTVGTADVTNIAVSCTTNTYSVGGSVTGLTSKGLVLRLDDHQNSPQSLAVSGDTSGNASFTFPNPVASGASYTVSVTTQPTEPDEVCTVASGTGTVTSANITNLTVTCSTSSYTVGGSVSGLQGSGLVLRLNGQNDLPVSGNVSFTFTTTPVASGAPYEVTVGVQPTSPPQSCTVTHGSGTVTTANITDVAVTCASPSRTVSTLAGSAEQTGSTDATGVAARFRYPCDVAVDGSGNVYVADTNNHTIRKITSSGVATTLAGTAGQSGSADATGAAARFYLPIGVAVDGAGNVYVADFSNNTIRKVTPAGVVSTLAGTAGQSGSTDATGAAARFYYPSGVAVDSSGNVYVTDRRNHTIRKITSSGDVTTLAGTAGQTGSTDATGAAARFNCPDGVAVDSSGNVYVADLENHTIRKITSSGDVTTLAGTAGQTGSTDATGSAARFYYPAGVALDGAGNVYVADMRNHNIRKITPAGVVSTLAGTAGQYGSTDATGAVARFYNPSGVAVDGAGYIYVADQSNSTIRKITP